MLLSGRTKIFSDEERVTDQNILNVLNDALIHHRQNSLDCDYLYKYRKGIQPILERVKVIRPEICNKIVENRADEIVAFKTGYLCGEPLQYISRGSNENTPDSIGKLNDMMLLCGKPAMDRELAEWMYTCGVGYRIVIPNSPYIDSAIIPKMLSQTTDYSEDEAPFEAYVLDPRNTFVVYHSGLGEKPLMGVKYVVKKDNETIYSCYVDGWYYEITSSGILSNFGITKKQKRAISDIPVIEYPLNYVRMGAFETVIPLMDAINTVQSNRVDGIESFVQSLWILYNCDIEDDAAKAIREAGLIKLKSVGENKADIKQIVESLDQQQTQVLIDYLYQTILNIVGMPNRNGGTSTSDTGAAVTLRDGHSSAESRAKSDELMFKESERKFLKIVLQIMRMTVGTDLALADIETQFTRRNYENIANKSQVLTTMLSNDKIAPILAFTHCGMFSDPEDAAKISADHYDSIKEQQKEAMNTFKNPTGADPPDKEDPQSAGDAVD